MIQQQYSKAASGRASKSNSLAQYVPLLLLCDRPVRSSPTHAAPIAAAHSPAAAASHQRRGASIVAAAVPSQPAHVQARGMPLDVTSYVAANAGSDGEHCTKSAH